MAWGVVVVLGVPLIVRCMCNPGDYITLSCVQARPAAVHMLAQLHYGLLRADTVMDMLLAIAGVAFRPVCEHAPLCESGDGVVARLAVSRFDCPITRALLFAFSPPCSCTIIISQCQIQP